MEFIVENQSVRKVRSRKKYWFIRTFGGEAFDIYKSENFVGLGLNQIPLSLIKKTNKNDDVSFGSLKKSIENNTEYKLAEATKWANQLIDFTQNISIGDTVIIPSAYSEEIAIGTIKSDIYLVNRPESILHRGERVPLPGKRRKVKWDKTIYREELYGDLRGLFSSHNGITNADQYSEIIEGLISDIFIKDEKIYLVLKIDQDEEINAFAFNRFLESITYFYKEFCLENGEDENEDLTLKIKVQSKGKLALKGIALGGIIGLGGIIALSNNSELKVNLKEFKIEGKSDGPLKSLSDFLDRKQERRMKWEMFIDSMDEVKAKRYRPEHSQNDSTNNSKENGE